MIRRARLQPHQIGAEWKGHQGRRMVPGIGGAAVSDSWAVLKISGHAFAGRIERAAQRGGSGQHRSRRERGDNRIKDAGTRWNPAWPAKQGGRAQVGRVGRGGANSLVEAQVSSETSLRRN